MMWARIHHDGRIALDELFQHNIVPLINVTGGIFQHYNARSHSVSHKSVEIFYSETALMSYRGQHDRLIDPQQNSSGTSWYAGLVRGTLRYNHCKNCTWLYRRKQGRKRFI